jgi:Tfp pilus assembly protein PilO
MNRNITATILVVLAVGLYVTFTRGIWADATVVKGVNDQYSTAIASAEKLISLRDGVLKQFNSISPDDRDRLDRMVPNTVDNIRLIIDLNNVALQHGFSLRNVTASAKTSTASAPLNTAAPSSLGRSQAPVTPVLDTVAVSFSVSAPYQQFISLMQDLEASLRIMDITHLTINANDTGTYDFSVQLNTYWLRQ